MTHTPSRKYRKKSTYPQKTRHRFIASKDLFIGGIHSVLEALKACPDSVKEIFIEKSRKGLRLEELLDIAQQNSVPVTFAQPSFEASHKKRSGSLESENLQGVSAHIVLPAPSLEDLLNKLKSAPNPPLLLALDSIQDPHNLGAIIRSAVAAGVNGLILPKDRSASITPTVIKVSAGAAFHLDICRVNNLVNSFKALKEEGIWIFGTAKDSSQAVYEADLTVPACLVIGSEGKGLRPLVAEHCDMYISIPMQGSLDSLNASVAAGIILFETVRQRKMKSE